MKPSGIVRSIDDLGRISIPKEIRRAIGVEDGAPMEIFYDKSGNVVLRKYLPEKEKLLKQVECLDDAVSDMAVELGAKTTGDARRRIRELKLLLKEF